MWWSARWTRSRGERQLSSSLPKRQSIKPIITVMSGIPPSIRVHSVYTSQ